MAASISRRLAYALVVAAGLGAGACRRSPPAPPPPPPPPQFCIEASPQLNWYDGQAHTLYLRLFQLSQLDGFAAAEPGRLLDPTFMPPGTEGPPMERTVYPGTQIVVTVQPNPQARFLGVVSGYYRLTGSAKSQRSMPEVGNGVCMKLGPNGVESP